MKPFFRSLRGFSILELVLVLTIIAILALFAIPKYQRHTVKLRRTEAQMALLELAKNMENYYAEHQSFIGATLKNQSDSTDYYTLAINSASHSSFLISATPKSTQAIEDKSCGTLRLDQTGTKYHSGDAPSQQCW